MLLLAFVPIVYIPRCQQSKSENGTSDLFTVAATTNFFLLNELICWLILGVQLLYVIFHFKNVKNYISRQTAFWLFHKIWQWEAEVDLQFWFGVVSEHQISKNMIYIYNMAFVNFD